MQMCACIFVHTCMFACVCLHVVVHGVYVSMHVCACVCACLHVYIYVCDLVSLTHYETSSNSNYETE